MSSKPTPSSSSRPYISNGRMLDSPPLTARLSRTLTSTYNFLGLYVVSFFSLDPYVAAQESSFNTTGRGRSNARNNTGSASAGPAGQRLGGSGGSGGRGGGWGGWFGGGSAGRGSGGTGGGSSSSRRFATVDDVRGPECGSCG